jgi:hypothetical protein
MQILEKHEEENDNAVDVIRFLLKDGAFENEFLLTAVLEYVSHNDKSDEIAKK